MEDEQEWLDDDEICLLCDKPNEPSKSHILKERAINNLILASHKRKDKKHLKLQKLKEITVHKTCQTLYTRESNIKRALAASALTWLKDRNRCKEGRGFAFSTHCFFCSNQCHSCKQNLTRVSKQETIDNILAQLQALPKSEENKILASRLSNLKKESDNYYIENTVYYHSKCLSVFYSYSPCNVKGRPITEDMSNLLSFIINYLLENSDQCQFSLKDILQIYVNKFGDTDLPRLGRIEILLKNHFEDEIVIYSSSNDRFICFKQTLGKCIQDSWYSNRKVNEKEERLRIVELASHFILQDVRAMKVDLENYNTPTDFLNNIKDIPETLQLMLEILIKTHKHERKNGSWDKWENRIVTAAHILISSMRPRSFSSPILLGLSCMIHTKFAARGLIDCLYNIGLCESYAETVRFENSLVNDPEHFDFIGDTYLQFVYDNADHNTATIDGKNTFHCMGGIMCATPSSSVNFNNCVPRLKGTLSTSTDGTFGFLPLTDFKNNKPFKLDNITIRNWKEIHRADFTIEIKAIDFLYFYGKHTAPRKTPNWHGFMNKFHLLNNDFCTTRIIALPFIKAPPSDHTTILTSLIDARRRANANNQKHCFVTFDLPLYMKASEIVASIEADNDPHNIRSVIPRLGFHLAMSFLGAIGNIMVESGLKEAFSTIYAELSADKALTGHAFSRSVRGHLLVQAALATIILEKIEFTEEEKTFLDDNLQKVGTENFENYLMTFLMKSVQIKFSSVITNLENNGPTSQLWLQYFKLIYLLQRYIDAERSGNSDQHVETVTLMIPFFRFRSSFIR